MKKLYLKIKNGLCSISSDKYLHVLVSLILLQVVAKLLGDVQWSILIVFGIGALKESFDKFIMKEDFSCQYLEADAYGILVGVVLLII